MSRWRGIRNQCDSFGGALDLLAGLVDWAMPSAAVFWSWPEIICRRQEVNLLSHHAPRRNGEGLGLVPSPTREDWLPVQWMICLSSSLRAMSTFSPLSLTR